MWMNCRLVIVICNNNSAYSPKLKIELLFFGVMEDLEATNTVL